MKNILLIFTIAGLIGISYSNTVIASKDKKTSIDLLLKYDDQVAEKISNNNITQETSSQEIAQKFIQSNKKDDKKLVAIKLLVYHPNHPDLKQPASQWRRVLLPLSKETTSLCDAFGLLPKEKIVVICGDFQNTDIN